jgi:hypothetical protein
MESWVAIKRVAGSAAIGLALTSLAAGAQAQPVKAKPIGALSIYDANGKKVGKVLDMNDGRAATVPVRIAGTTILLTVHRDYMWAAGPSLSFESTDCTGTPYIEASTSYLVTEATTCDPNLTVYVPQPGAPVQAVSIGSEAVNLLAPLPVTGRP